MMDIQFYSTDVFRTSFLVAFLLLIQLSGYTSNARGNVGVYRGNIGEPPLGTSSVQRRPYIPPRPVWCRYGYYIGCCYGWRRDPASGQCTPICRNGCVHGTCVAPDRCQCDRGYTGATCELDYNECSRRPCQHRCMNTYGSYRCYCEQGYMLSNNAKNCYRDNRCSRAKCAYGCVQKTSNNVRCICPRGWRVDENGRGCIDVDECALHPNICPAGRRCWNTHGSFTCLCPSGQSYQWINDRLVCSDEDECAVRKHNCDEHATCFNKVNGFTCVCKRGYVGDGKTCIEVREPPRNEAVNPPGLVADSRTCADKPCFFGVECVNNFINPNSIEYLTGDTKTIKMFRCGPCPEKHVGDGEKCKKLPNPYKPPTKAPLTRTQATPTTKEPSTVPITTTPIFTTTITPTLPTTPVTTTIPTTIPTTTPLTTTLPTTTATTTVPTTTVTTTMPTTTITTTLPTTTMPTTIPTTTVPTTTPTTIPPTTTPLTTTNPPTTTPTTNPPTTTPTTNPPTTTPTTLPPTTTPTTMPTTTATTTVPTTNPPTTTPTTLPPTTTPTTAPPTTTIPTTTPPTTIPTTTATTTVPTTTPMTTLPTTTPTTTVPTTTIPTTTLPPTTTIPTTTPTTEPPTTTIPTTTLPPTTTPPPPGVRIVTTDRLSEHALLPGVDIRVLVPGSNITKVYTEGRTGGSGSILLDLPEDEPVIITFSRNGYLKTSMTYKYERVGRNVITMPINRAPEYRDFIWRSGLGAEFEFRKNTINAFKIEVPPGALDVPEGEKMTVEFKEVDVQNAQDLREAPELIGAHLKKKSDDDYVFEGLETFGMVEVTIDEWAKTDPSDFRLFLPLTLEIPLRNVPPDVGIGDKLEAWSYDPFRGVWLFEGKGTVERGRGAEKIFIFYARHLSWWAVVRRIDVTNCVTVTTCYDKKCLTPAPNVPVRLRGVDFLYSSTRTSNENGQACFHYKRHGEVEISSQCAHKVRLSRGKGKSSTCPANFNSQLIITEAKKAHNNCGNVKLIVPVSLTNTCPYIDKPDRSNIVGNDRIVGAAKTFNCDVHYVIEGPREWYCQECGIWKGHGQTSCVHESSLEKPTPAAIVQPFFGTTKDPVFGAIDGSKFTPAPNVQGRSRSRSRSRIRPRPYNIKYFR